MVPPNPQLDTSRRQFITRQLRWVVTVTLAGLSLPLLRFTGHTIKPEPRYITVDKTLAPGTFHTGHDFILFVLEEGPVAVSRRCTHLGCRLNFRQELNLIECPCHQSQFTPQGIRLAGPAQKNLPTFPVRILVDENGAPTGYEVTV